MKYSEIKLSSNRKFGSFSTLILLLVAGYCFWIDHIPLSVVVITFAISSAIITAIKDSMLLHPNKACHMLAYIMAKIAGTFALGILFFLIFTPLAVTMRLSGRDKLRLKPISTESFWKTKSPNPTKGSFKNQF
jgi:hypothetical protein